MTDPRSAIEIVKGSELSLWPGNARTNDVEKLRKGIRKYGFYSVLTVQRSSNRIIVGNHRFMAGTEEGMDEFPVKYLEIGDDEANALNVWDNKSSDDGDYDDALLIAQLEQLQATEEGLEHTGWDDEELALLKARQADDDDGDGDDGPADLEKDPVVLICPNCGDHFEMSEAERE